MTTIRLPEGTDGIDYTFTVKQEGSNTAEDLSAYSTATMAVTSLDFETVHNAAISLTFVVKASGTVKYTSESSTDTLPAVPKKQKELRLRGKITFSASGVLDRSNLIDIIIEKNISGV